MYIDNVMSYEWSTLIVWQIFSRGNRDERSKVNELWLNLVRMLEKVPVDLLPCNVAFEFTLNLCKLEFKLFNTIFHYKCEIKKIVLHRNPQRGSYIMLKYCVLLYLRYSHTAGFCGVLAFVFSFYLRQDLSWSLIQSFPNVCGLIGKREYWIQLRIYRSTFLRSKTEQYDV